MLTQRHRYVSNDSADCEVLLQLHNWESRQVFFKLTEILAQTKSMQDKLASVISRFDQISHKTPKQREIFYDNVNNLQNKLINQENLLKEKLHLHVIEYFNNRNLRQTILKNGIMEGETSTVTATPRGPASLTKAQKNACNRIRKIRDKLKGTNIEALNVLERIQKTHASKN